VFTKDRFHCARRDVSVVSSPPVRRRFIIIIIITIIIIIRKHLEYAITEVQEYQMGLKSSAVGLLEIIYIP
jgi:hypothetical protein